MSSLAVEAEPRAERTRVERPPAAAGRLRLHPGAAAVAGGVATAIALCAFVAQGGNHVEPTTWVEVGLMLAGGGLASAAVVDRRLRGGAGPLYGAAALAAFTLLAVLTAVSIVWSLAPSDSWLEAGRTLAYLAAFAGAIALARLAPGRWAALLYGIALGTLAVCGWSLMTKTFPGALASDEPFARLRPPFAYWNSVGLMGALGVPPFLWLAARRSGHQPVNALAWPALGLLFVCLMLSYSRGALLALALGLATWFALVPLRLRAAAALLGAACAAVPVIAWAFARDGLTVDRAPLAARIEAGQQLGALLLLMACALLIAGLAVGFLRAQRPPARRARRRAGWTLAGALALVPVVVLIAVASAPGGLSGQVSKSWHQLTDPNARTPANTPDRLTATSSVRARYWREALDVHGLSPWLGTGAGSYATARTRFRTTPVAVRHAHGYVVQTLADLGWVGLGVSLLALALWLAAAARAAGLRRRDRGLPIGAERVGLLTMLAVVVVFGVHSAIDWTWFVPGNVLPALLCGGWLAGRGPHGARLAARGPGRRRLTWGAAWRAAPTALVPVVAALAAWAALQPVRSIHAEDAAFARLSQGAPDAAASIARIAHERNPLSVDPLFDLAAIEQARGRRPAAERALEDAVALQPANAETWRRLGHYRMDVLGDARAALPDFRVAFDLDPQNPRSQSDVIRAARQASG